MESGTHDKMDFLFRTSVNKELLTSGRASGLQYSHAVAALTSLVLPIRLSFFYAWYIVWHAVLCSELPVHMQRYVLKSKDLKI